MHAAGPAVATTCQGCAEGARLGGRGLEVAELVAHHIHHAHTSLSPAGTWVTFGGQITDEVRLHPFTPSLPSLSLVSGEGLGPAQPRLWPGCMRHAGAHQRSAHASVRRLSATPFTDPALSSQMAEQLMTLAYDNGINLFDTAEVYAAGK